MSPAAMALRAYRAVGSESMAHGGKGAELVVMLYDGIIESLSKSRGHMERKEYAELGHQYSRALTIIAGLKETLDFDRGQPVANQLLEFYNSLTVQLLKARTSRDFSLLDSCIELVTSVRSSWEELAKRGEMAPSSIGRVRAAPSGLMTAISPA
jgi:flagellar secretion chaperone FliS